MWAEFSTNFLMEVPGPLQDCFSASSDNGDGLRTYSGVSDSIERDAGVYFFVFCVNKVLLCLIYLKETRVSREQLHQSELNNHRRT